MKLVKMYDRRGYRDMLRAGEIEKVVQIVDNSTGSRTTNLVAQAAFECEDYLPSIKEGAALIVAIVKKLNLHDQTESAIARYSAFVEGRAVADNSLVVGIDQLLANENDAPLLKNFVTIFKYISDPQSEIALREDCLQSSSDFPLKDYVDRLGKCQAAK